MVMYNAVVESFVEIRLKNPDDFNVIRETLSRIGIAVESSRMLYQSCHILHKQGKYYIVHFKECHRLDGRPDTFSVEDLARRNTISNMLAEWGLLELVNPTKTATPVLPPSQIKVIPFRDKENWTLSVKYSIGKNKRQK
ncbi:translational repressor RegA [Arthrospira platensis SPKY1]|nr:translational repressor RegA [Arthrospira platensis SPKY1]